MVQLRCPECVRVHNLPPGFPGKTVRCTCGHVIEVPAEEPDDDVFAIAAEPEAPSRPAFTLPSSGGSSGPTICPHCHRTIPSGGPVCPHCKRSVRGGDDENEELAATLSEWTPWRLRVVSNALWVMFLGELTTGISYVAILVCLFLMIFHPAFSILGLVALIAIPVARVTVLVTRFICLTAPLENHALLLVTGSLICDVIGNGLYLYYAFKEPAWNDLFELPFYVWALQIVAEILFLLFLKSICLMVEREELADDAQTNVNVFSLVLVVELIFSMIGGTLFPGLVMLLILVVWIMWELTVLLVTLFLLYKYFELLSGASTSLARLREAKLAEEDDGY